MPDTYPINELDKISYNPCACIVIYQKKEKGGGGSKFYLEHQSIVVIDGKPVACQSRPLSRQDLLAVTSAVEQENSFSGSGFLQNTLLYFNYCASGQQIVWWCPPGLKTLFFAGSAFKASGAANCPGLVFAFNHQGLFVFALKGKKRPDLSTSIYQAPFSNINTNGLICMGSARLPDIKSHKTVDIIKMCEKSFFFSEFCGHLDARKILKTQTLSGIWKTLIEDNKKPFPEKELMPHSSKTLNGLFSNLGINF